MFRTFGRLKSDENFQFSALLDSVCIRSKSKDRWIVLYPDSSPWWPSLFWDFTTFLCDRSARGYCLLCHIRPFIFFIGFMWIRVYCSLVYGALRIDLSTIKMDTLDIFIWKVSRRSIFLKAVYALVLGNSYIFCCWIRPLCLVHCCYLREMI